MARFNVEFKKQDYFNIDFKGDKQLNIDFGTVFEVPIDVSNVYNGSTLIRPKPYEIQILETKDKMLFDNITIDKIPYYKISNNAGTTVYIGGND